MNSFSPLKPYIKSIYFKQINMKIKQIIKKLQKLDPEMEIFFEYNSTKKNGFELRSADKIEIIELEDGSTITLISCKK